MFFLLKTEPDDYPFSRLLEDHETVWDGVTNAAAVKHLRSMKPGDKLVIYHTGDQRQAVGTAVVQSVEVPDPKTPLVRIRAGKAIKPPKALEAIKAAALFQDSPLVKQGRLSVVPLTAEQYRWLAQAR
jgi:predicted RNA-binding protein with PUA-like domain